MRVLADIVRNYIFEQFKAIRVYHGVDTGIGQVKKIDLIFWLIKKIMYADLY